MRIIHGGVKANHFYIILFVFFICSMNFFTEESTRKKLPEKFVVFEKENGKKIRIGLNSILLLKLEVFPGTGYRWILEKNKNHILHLCGNPKFEQKNKDERDEKVGHSEYQVFRFKALGIGSNELELHYMRKWEKGIKPLKIFKIFVEIF